MKKDVFCDIAEHTREAEFLFEDDELMVIKPLENEAPVHYLIIPKKHIKTINYIKEKDTELLGKMVLAARRAAKMVGIKQGYKLHFNVERGGGQTVFHIHLHLWGGW